MSDLIKKGVRSVVTRDDAISVFTGGGEKYSYQRMREVFIQREDLMSVLTREDEYSYERMRCFYEGGCNDWYYEGGCEVSVLTREVEVFLQCRMQ